MKRLIIAPNWIGDCVMSLPVVRALKRNDSTGRLTVLCRAGSAPIFRMEGSADEVWTLGRGFLERWIGNPSRARSAGLGEVWVLPNSFRSALLARLTGAPKRYGYATDGRKALLTTAPPRPDPVGHQLRDYDELLRAGGVEPDVDPPRLMVSAEAGRRAAAYLDSFNLEEGEAPAFFAPGAAFGDTKRWPAERFAFLADAMMDEGRKAAIVIGPSEEDLGRLIARRARHRIPVLGADLDSGGLAALFARGSVVIGNDSGPAHLAAAVGTPALVFFGPTDPGRTIPSGAPVVVVDRYVHCSPCFLKTCPFGHECMEEISVEMALEAVKKLLK